eukprot:scaffold49592_cov25-Phaeocystis_antarctica.AAC.1
MKASLALHWPSPAHARHSELLAHTSTGGACPAGSLSSSSSAAAATASALGPALARVRLRLTVGVWRGG